jgi:hypothetical protein
MDATKTGGPAYPVIGKRGDPYEWIRDDGMSMLDHFAGLAMQGWLSTFVGSSQIFPKERGAAHIASASYEMAAAMIAERNRLMNTKP